LFILCNLIGLERGYGMTQTYTLCELYEFLKMVKKFSITLSDAYNQALQEWAD